MNSNSSNSCLMMKGQHAYPTVHKSHQCTWQLFWWFLCHSFVLQKNKKEQYCADQYGFPRVWSFSWDKLRVVARAPSAAANRGRNTCFKFDFCRTIVLESSVIIWELPSMLNTNPYCNWLPHIWHAMHPKQLCSKMHSNCTDFTENTYKCLWTVFFQGAVRPEAHSLKLTTRKCVPAENTTTL